MTSDINIIEGLKHFTTNNVNDDNLDCSIPRYTHDDRSQTRTIDNNLLAQSVEDDAISNS